MNITRASSGMLTYRYRASADMSFAFHMLCEVGEPWQADAKAELDKLRERGYRIETRDIDEAPWIADFAVRDINQEKPMIYHLTPAQKSAIAIANSVTRGANLPNYTDALGALAALTHQAKLSDLPESNQALQRAIATLGPLREWPATSMVNSLLDQCRVDVVNAAAELCGCRDATGAATRAFRNILLGLTPLQPGFTVGDVARAYLDEARRLLDEADARRAQAGNGGNK